MTSSKSVRKSAKSASGRKNELLAFEQIKWNEGFSFVAGVDEVTRYVIRFVTTGKY